MRILHLVIFCCILGVCAASGVLEVSGHVGGEVSILCSDTTTNSSELSNMYFCKGDCARENILIQTEKKSLAITRRGRYSMEVSRGDGAFNVTIKRLERADTGTYQCRLGETYRVLHQEVNLKVEDASTVPIGPPPSTTTPSLQTEAQALPQGSSASSTEASMLPTTETNQPAATKLKDATVVIIVSVTLALLVCSIIPLIFYGHCRNNAGLNKSESDYCEENTDGASPHSAVRLQALEAGADPESSIPDASQYAAVYQALDPKTMD
ncbi:hepatitis A virus cellular receptor 1 homolog isoform X2 [Gymnodraco acuticeps]|uniref:Hepatitis A virus cellular receptor 1 homolog isoform X2 n=1 Tax=Gymnodraco acuticeps TaxID=8218 RepID=A0A6P8VVW6_GYMAC|nr:hepatitis A virus cellular receptor 1 homolog isoform X2 [Gymnodraco acuticeps]